MAVRITRVTPLDSPDQRTEAALSSLRDERAKIVNDSGIVGPKGPKGDKGEKGEALFNIDGGKPGTNYGGSDPLDCGGP